MKCSEHHPEDLQKLLLDFVLVSLPHLEEIGCRDRENGDIFSGEAELMGLLDQTENASDPPPIDPNDKSRLFQTVSRSPSSSRNYVKTLLPIVGLVIIAGIAYFYFTIPGIGDTFRPQTELDLGVRYHLLEKHGRVATDITFYKCDGFSWALADVEKRPDIPNPVLQLGSYTVKAVPNGANSWDFTSRPLEAGDKPAPCSEF